MKASRGEIWLVRLDPGAEGHELRKTRPCVVVQADALNRRGSTCIIAAITEHSDKKAAYPFCVTLAAGDGGLAKRSVVDAVQVRTVDDIRMIRCLGRLTDEVMVDVDDALRIVLALDRYPIE